MLCLHPVPRLHSPLLFFFVYGYGDPRDLPSFPPRRSSDLGIEIPGYLRPPLAGASKVVPDGTAAGSPGFQSGAGEATAAPEKGDARLTEPYRDKPRPYEPGAGASLDPDQQSALE